MALLLAYAVQAAALAVSAYAAESPFKGCKEHVRWGVPRFTQIPAHESTPLCRLGYALSHNNDKKVADWVSWHLDAVKAASCGERKDAFKADPDLPPGKRAELSDYRGSGFDRGHLAPNADFNWSQEAARESFYLSNMTPQLAGLNRGIWKALEEAERVWATERGEVYIIAGPIFTEEPVRTIGGNGVGVPSHYFKIIYDPAAAEALAFVFPHGQILGKNFSVFQFAVRDVEGWTGLNFLSRIPGEKEEQVETVVAPLWGYDAKKWRRDMRVKCRVN